MCILKEGGDLRKFACTAVILVVCSVLAGCEFENVDSLLAPPKLSIQQQEISKALQEKAGKNIKLKYPKSGSYRSAFVISDIDDEPTDEAIVFYENTSPNKSSGSIRIEILDYRNGKWTSVFSHPVSATDVEEIMVTRLGNSDMPFIIVGYSALGQSDKIVEIYQYTSGSVLSTVYTDYYSQMILTDLDGNGTNQLVMINPESKDNPPYAKITSCDGDRFITEYTVELSSQISKIVNITDGYVSADRRALYIDGIVIQDSYENNSSSKQNIQTQIIYYSGGVIRNPLIESNSMLMSVTSRSDGYYSMDIDGDGIVEIPHLYECPGYQNTDPKMYFTDWFVYERASFMRKCTGYYNITDGYCFLLPSRWNGTVTLKMDPATDELVFYKFNYDLNNSSTELMRIKTCQASESADYIEDGYRRVSSKGQFEYLIKLSDDESESLVPTWSEVLFNFVNI